LQEKHNLERKAETASCDLANKGKVFGLKNRIKIVIGDIFPLFYFLFYLTIVVDHGGLDPDPVVRGLRIRIHAL
jgi:hypothetical protein